MRQDQYTRAFCTMVMVGGWMAVTTNAMPRGAFQANTRFEMEEAWMNSIERRHFDVYKVYLRVQDTLPVDLDGSSQGACVARGTVSNTAEYIEPSSRCEKEDFGSSEKSQ